MSNINVSYKPPLFSLIVSKPGSSSSSNNKDSHRENNYVQTFQDILKQKLKDEEQNLFDAPARTFPVLLNKRPLY